MFDYEIVFPHSKAGSDIINIAASRAVHEAVVRRRTLANPKVAFRTGAVVEGLLLDKPGAAGAAAGTGTGNSGSERSRPVVRGLRLRGGEALQADLVVDASGRGSKTADWLEAAGIEPPPKLVFNSNLGYGTRLYRVQPHFLSSPPAHNAVLVGCQPHGTRTGIAWQIEGNAWQVRPAACLQQPICRLAGTLTPDLPVASVALRLFCCHHPTDD